MQEATELLIIAGANGTGKTTFAIPYVKERALEFLNADEIAKELDDQGHLFPMIKAGRIFFERLQKNLDDQTSFVVETTLSGCYINKVAIKARKKGYLVKVIHIC